MKIKMFLKTCFVLVATIAPVVLFAQVLPPGDVNDVPLDGGISLLVAAGVGYGIKKYRDAKKVTKVVQKN